MKKREPLVIYYHDELNDEFSSAVITPKPIDENWVYIHTSLWKKFTRFFWLRMVATPIAYTWIRLKFRHKMVGREKLKAVDKKQGYFLYGNHTQPTADALIPTMLAGARETYVIVHPNNVSMPYLGRITPSLGALPLPDNLAAMRNFNRAVETRIAEGCCVAVYPEAHIWPYYTGIRPYLDTSFSFPIRLETPVFCFTNTYQKRGKSNKPRIITYVDGPFYPDPALKGAAQRRELRDRVHAAMCERSRLSNCEVIKYVRSEDNA